MSRSGGVKDTDYSRTVQPADCLIQPLRTVQSPKKLR